MVKSLKGFGSVSKQVYTETIKQCSKCKEFKFHDQFHKDQTNISGGGLSYWCKQCATANTRRYHQRRMIEDLAYKEAKRNNYIKCKYGITALEYEAKLVAQDYLCAICKVKLLSHGSGTHLDHCHKTGKLRAMLCTNCNRGLGHFKDSILFLQNAIDYLSSHIENGTQESEEIL